ncbi:glycosyl transferase WecB/TagA/CpsF family protein [Blastomonas sp. RAC04]|uniref:WecB/TagA/CpsF family glycosyltransferase n=1 Tax=Blastomonas sp. RAC04 TaxID=1842535 RepID=UPI00083DEB3C|nr:WecB/TagA/CpsF family glycosyltransferase [Blastomonas sp. RAC04]AOG01341.1 glycosyl transferase WecB/TagA/CpsF family protein [Blastomonas sp. RAC04]
MNNKLFHSLDEACNMATGYLVTVNMQHLYELQSNVGLATLFRTAPDMNVCVDGRGAELVIRKSVGRRIPIVVGNELTKALLDRNPAESFLIIGSKRKYIEQLRQLYPHARFDHDDGMFDISSQQDARQLAGRFAEHDLSAYRAVFIALGVPKQEMLASELSAMHGGARFYCIGGSFEMITGGLKRAPRLVQAAGMEALWRLLLQPSKGRLRRAFKTYYHFLRFYLDPKTAELPLALRPAR